jgi:hypothetical protein
MPFDPYGELLKIQELGARAAAPATYQLGLEAERRQLQDELTLQSARDAAARDRALIAAEGQRTAYAEYAKRIAAQSDEKTAQFFQRAGIPQNPGESDAAYNARAGRLLNERATKALQQEYDRRLKVANEIDLDENRRRRELSAAVERRAAAAAMSAFGQNPDIIRFISKNAKKYLNEDGSHNIPLILEDIAGKYPEDAIRVRAAWNEARGFAMEDLSKDSRYSIENAHTRGLYQNLAVIDGRITTLRNQNPQAILGVDPLKGAAQLPELGAPGPAGGDLLDLGEEAEKRKPKEEEKPRADAAEAAPGAVTAAELGVVDRILNPRGEEDVGLLGEAYRAAGYPVRAAAELMTGLPDPALGNALRRGRAAILGGPAPPKYTPPSTVPPGSVPEIQPGGLMLRNPLTSRGGAAEFQALMNEVLRTATESGVSPTPRTRNVDLEAMIRAMAGAL